MTNMDPEKTIFDDEGELSLKQNKKISWKTKVLLVISVTILTYMLIYTRNERIYNSNRIINGSVYPSENVLDQYMSIERDPLGEPLGYPTLNPNSSHLHTGLHAMVSCDVPICSKIGVDILKKGGSAADAAVTVALCIGSVNLHSSGIGGGAFITSLYENDVISIDAREMAPDLAFKEMYKGNEVLSKFGGLAVAVPGELKGLYELYERHGSKNLTWFELFEPVIELNRQGFYVSKVLENALNSNSKIIPKLSKTGLLDSWDFIFKDPENQELGFVREGDLVKRPNLADTLELIGNNGSSAAFYDPEGPIVSSLVEEIQRTGGWITAEDFSNYEVNVEKALKFDFKTPEVDTEDTNDYTLYTASGASSGLALIAGLNFFLSLENFNATDDKLLRVHRVIETMKWMASARSNFGDFSIHQDNSTFRENLIDKYSSKKWAQETIDRKYSDNNTFPWEHYDPKYQLTEPHGTSHFSIVDANGNAVGMTTTVNLLFGSLVYDNKTGVILNNEMDDFSVPGLPNAFNLTPLIYNFIEPRKRPLSSTSPTIVVTNQGVSLLPSLVIGAAGGSRITTAILQSIINVFYDKVPLLEAISYPRLHHQLIPEYVMCENYEVFEDRYQVDDLLEILNEDFGHDFYQSGPLTVMNGIRRKDSGDTTGAGEHDTYSWQGVADYWRKLGEASGY